MDSSSYNEGLDQAENKANSFGSKLKSGLGAVGKIGAAAVGAAATAIGAVVSKSIDAYGNYEQLVGGVETLFGDSAQKVIADAQNAFQTAGMSMNAYMETSIQSAASLINSLDGDQAKAAELMNMSITDMADNVNKMGTTMASVQDAYRGFSRGNFTMLDNLALGFAGTKEGMQGLLDKAKEISGIEYDISSYSDIVEAIHVVQTEMGITGTTAREAASTIQGSFSAVKSAWENLVAGIADPNADIGKLVSNLVSSAGTAVKNVLPVVKQALSGIGKAITEIAPVIGETVSGLLTDVGPDLIQAALDLVKGIGGALLDNADTVVDAAFDVINMIVDAFSDHSTIARIGSFASELLWTLSRGLAQNLPTILPTITGIIMDLVGVFTDPENLGNMVDAAIAILLALADGLAQSVGVLAEKAPEIIENLVIALVNAVPDLAVAAVQIIEKLGQGLIDAGGALWDYVVQVMEPVTSWVSETWANITQPIKDAWNAILDIISPIIDALKEQFDVFGEIAAAVWGRIKEAVSTAVNNISAALEPFKQKIEELKNKFDEVRQKVVEAFQNIEATIREKINAALSWGEDLMRNLAQGIANGIKWVTDKVKSVASTISSWLHQTTADVGPLKYTDQWTPDLMDNLIHGFDSKRGELERKVADIAKSMDMSGAINMTDTMTFSSANADSETQMNSKINAIIDEIRSLKEAIYNMGIEMDGEKVADLIDSKLGSKAALAARV